MSMIRFGDIQEDLSDVERTLQHKTTLEKPTGVLYHYTWLTAVAIPPCNCIWSNFPSGGYCSRVLRKLWILSCMPMMATSSGVKLIWGGGKRSSLLAPLWVIKYLFTLDNLATSFNVWKWFSRSKNSFEHVLFVHFTMSLPTGSIWCTEHKPTYDGEHTLMHRRAGDITTHKC